MLNNKNIEVYINNIDNLSKLGLNFEDIDDLKKVIDLLNQKGLIIINDSMVKSFDLQNFFLDVIADKAILKVVLTYYANVNNLLERVGVNPGYYNFKWNLSLLILLNKFDYLHNYYEVESLLDMDKNDNSVKIYNDLFTSFFEFMRLNLTSLDQIYNLFNHAITLERSGWVGKNLPMGHKESIAEHMYMMQILAKMYLPEVLDNIDDYNKQDVIDMVLLHDLGETITGDIPHPDKKNHDEVIEDLKVKALGIGLIYFDCPYGRRFLKLWNEWNLNFTTSAKIAHDLDVVQLNNQLLNYAVKYPDYFTIDELKLWYRRRPIYDLGKEIFQKIIQSDEKKLEIVKQIFDSNN